MCGRYIQTTELQTLQTRFLFDHSDVDLVSRYNIAPGQASPVIVSNGSRTLKMMKWGLVPSWAKDPAIGNRMINARAETVAEKPSFRNAFNRRRCLILANGFYEWYKPPDKSVKTPIHFFRKDNQPFAFAGLWENWADANGAELQTYTIITTEANDFVRPFHHRMPVILRPDDESVWLGNDANETNALDSIVHSIDWPDMDSARVTTYVNSPRNQGPSCIIPLQD